MEPWRSAITLNQRLAGWIAYRLQLSGRWSQILSDMAHDSDATIMSLKPLLFLASVFLTAIPVVIASADASKSPQFQTLPPLREQAKIVDAWTETRKSLIPGILRKYNVDAWLVSTLPSGRAQHVKRR